MNLDVRDMQTEAPFRLKVLMNMTESFESISRSAGYNFDMAENVIRGRNRFGPNDPLPLISILEPPVQPDEIPTPNEIGIFAGNWQILVQGFLPDDFKNPTDMGYYLLADVKRILGEERTRYVPNAAQQSDRFRNPFGMGRYREGLDSERKANWIESLNFGVGVVRPADEVVSDKAYFWLPVTLKIYEDTLNPFV